MKGVKSVFIPVFLTGAIFLGGATVCMAQQKVVIGSLVSGQISQVYVSEGQTVKAGSRLLTLDSDRYQAKTDMLMAKVKAAKVGLNDAQIELDQALDLYDRTVTSKRTLDTSQMRFDQAKAQFDEANSSLKMHQAWAKYIYIKAPIAGKIVKIHTPKGTTVFKENTPMIEILP